MNGLNTSSILQLMMMLNLLGNMGLLCDFAFQRGTQQIRILLVETSTGTISIASLRAVQLEICLVENDSAKNSPCRLVGARE